MNPNFLPKLIGAGVLIFVLVVIGSATSYMVEPGTRGIKVTLGKAEDRFLPEGFGLKAPFITTVVPVNVRQKTMPVKADCFSSDLQQVSLEVRVLYRVPEQSVVQIYKEFAGDPFDSLIAPRVQEALKEVTALQTAEQIVKTREEIVEGHGSCQAQDRHTADGRGHRDPQHRPLQRTGARHRGQDGG